MIADGGYAAYFDGQNATLTNRGKIISGEGIRFVEAGTGTGRVINHGLICGGGIEMSDLQKVVVRNFGMIDAPHDDAVRGNDLRDVVINEGRMIGSVDLQAGNDLYNGRGGIVFGTILGNEGNDRFILGSGIETIDGGTENDTLDFRNGGGVKVSLDGGFVNAGWAAKGDVYAGIENIFGSLTGADSLDGDVGANDLRGFGGKDTIDGGSGDDTITGGAGVDTIST